MHKGSAAIKLFFICSFITVLVFIPRKKPVSTEALTIPSINTLALQMNVPFLWCPLALGGWNDWGGKEAIQRWKGGHPTVRLNTWRLLPLQSWWRECRSHHFCSSGQAVLTPQKMVPNCWSSLALQTLWNSRLTWPNDWLHSQITHFYEGKLKVFT